RRQGKAGAARRYPDLKKRRVVGRVIVVFARGSAAIDRTGLRGRRAAGQRQGQRQGLCRFRAGAPAEGSRAHHDRHVSSIACGAASCSWVISDRKSTRLNSSHVKISYAVFCLKKKK